MKTWIPYRPGLGFAKTLIFLICAVLPPMGHEVFGQYPEVVINGTHRCPIPQYPESRSPLQEQKLVEELLSELGLFRNFEIVRCEGIDNALARIVEIRPGQIHRFIFYDPEFLLKLQGDGPYRWTALSIFAHEIAHHLNGHTLGYRRGKFREELEADYSSGNWLARMGASLEEAQRAISAIPYDYATITHPAKADRLRAVENGWRKARGLPPLDTPSTQVPMEWFVLGERAFADHNYRKAISYFERSREQGNADALYFLSHLNYTGLGTDKDLNQALKLAYRGYNLGSVPCVYQLGKYLALGTGAMEKDSAEAHRLFAKDFQFKWFSENYKDRRVPHYAYVMGFMLENGYGGVERDSASALDWYRAAAREGELSALMNLGITLENGGVVEEPAKAVEWFRKAALQGEPAAMYRLGNFYAGGLGVEKDSEQAGYWFDQAARRGEHRAMYHLGVMYNRGIGVVADEQKAVYWIKLAAENGNVAAMYYLGHFFQHGKG